VTYDDIKQLCTVCM